jgi:hypothetical protein
VPLSLALTLLQLITLISGATFLHVFAWATLLFFLFFEVLRGADLAHGPNQ